MRTTLTVLTALALALTVPACGGDAVDEKPSYPGTADGAKALLQAFLAPDADYKALSDALRPTDADYEAAFTPEAAAKAKAGYEKPWDDGLMVLKPGDPERTEILIWAATAEELQTKTGDAREFPGGYAQAAPHLKPGTTWYRVKFVKPGERSGMAFDGLVHVNGRWVVFPKPWRVLE